MTSPLEPRLAAIERALALLSAEVARIRAEVEGAPVERPPVGVPRPPRARNPVPNVTAAQFENLVGRYGMLAIAVFALVAAVGTFLKWAIGHGYLSLSPSARVILGIAFAFGLAVWGLRLRRTERSFGSSIVGLALVVGQVCAYAAGPSLNLVPTSVAFLGAAAASWALALFAHAENDEPLWCVGFGGAALAPFVTSDGRGSVYAIAGYSALVLLPACFAISHRNWRIAWRVFYLASGLLVLATAAKSHTSETAGYLVALALPFVVAGAGVVPFAPDSRKRGALRWLVGLAALGTFAENTTLDLPMVVIAASSISIAAWLVLLDRHATMPQSTILDGRAGALREFDWIDAALLPSMLAIPPVIAFETGPRAVPAYAIAALLLGVFSVRRALGSLRDAAALAALAFAAAVIVALDLGSPVAIGAAFVVLGWTSLALHCVRPSRSWLAGGQGALVLVSTYAASMLLRRHGYVQNPFQTGPSLLAAVALAGWALPSRFAHSLTAATLATLGDADRASDADRRTLIAVSTATAVAAWIWGFIWVVVELSMAYSASTSILSLVAWYAVTAVACVGVGRARGASRLRQVGLALGIIAGVTAFYGANSYFDFGARIVAYLITSAFLLGIAYWYRRPGSRGAGASSARLDPDQDGTV